MRFFVSGGLKANALEIPAFIKNYSGGTTLNLERSKLWQPV